MSEAEPETSPVAEKAATENTSAGADGFAVIDDEEPAMEPAIEWAGKQLVAGMTFEMVSANLRSGGWSADAAESIVEQARQQTRAARGVVTRDDVAMGSERRYRRTLANMRWIAFGGLPIFIVGVRNLIIAIRGIWNTPSASPDPATAKPQTSEKPRKPVGEGASRPRS